MEESGPEAGHPWGDTPPGSATHERGGGGGNTHAGSHAARTMSGAGLEHMRGGSRSGGYSGGGGARPVASPALERAPLCSTLRNPHHELHESTCTYWGFSIINLREISTDCNTRSRITVRTLESFIFGERGTRVSINEYVLHTRS